MFSGLIGDMKMIIAGVSVFLVSAVLALHKAFAMGERRQKNKQTANDLESANDAKQRLEDNRNKPIDEKLDSLHKHG